MLHEPVVAVSHLQYKKNKVMLNAKQIIDEGLLLLEHTQGKPAQVGYDLSLKAVQKVGNKIGGGVYNLSRGSRIGKVLKNKTELTTYTPANTIMLDGVEGWLLHEGVYDITFNEGCKIPDNRVAFIKQRSSLYRNGAIINSPVFDPGFETEFMGTLVYVYETIFIEKDARVAQIYFHECGSAEKYDGQWQNDKQRASL
jgi:deoxycytidine triphosphate deaminase